MYSPTFPLIFHQYVELLTNEDRPGRPASTTEQKLRQREHEPREVAVKITSEVEPQRRHTLLESAHDVGGISVFIYLFAKVGTWLNPCVQVQRQGILFTDSMEGCLTTFRHVMIYIQKFQHADSVTESKSTNPKQRKKLILSTKR